MRYIAAMVGVIDLMVKGSCLCGKVRYEIRRLPESMYYCHCNMCRKATGSAFATNMLVRQADFTVKIGGSLIKAFQSSPGERRYFCANCGSPLYSKAAARPDSVSVRCGTLDDDPLIRPAKHIHTNTKAPWFHIDDALRQYPEEPDT